MCLFCDESIVGEMWDVGKTMWDVKNQLGKHIISCGSVVNNLKEKKPFVPLK